MKADGPSTDVAYLKLSSISTEAIDDYLERLAGTEGLVIDIRNYPSEFVVFALGTHLVDEPTEFARFTIPNLSNPGALEAALRHILGPDAEEEAIRRMAARDGA